MTEYAPLPWEVEEVLCVHKYFVDRLEAVFDQVEEEFIQSAIATTNEPETLGGSLDTTRRPSPLFELDDDICGTGGDQHFFWTTSKKYRSLTVERLANSGMSFLPHLFRTPDENYRRKIVTQDFLSYLLFYGGRTSQLLQAQTPVRRLSSPHF